MARWGGLWTIYVARGLASGLLKIGRSQNVRTRMRDIARAVESVELLATFVDRPEAETALHRRFASSLEPSRGREWFRDDGAIRAWLDALPPEHRGSVVFGVRRYGSPSAEWQALIDAGAPRSEARKARQRADHARRFEAHHGHSFVPGQQTPGCAACAVRASGYAAAGRSRSATWAKRAPQSPLLTPSPLHLAGRAV